MTVEIGRITVRRPGICRTVKEIEDERQFQLALAIARDQRIRDSVEGSLEFSKVTPNAEVVEAYRKVRKSHPSWSATTAWSIAKDKCRELPSWVTHAYGPDCVDWKFNAGEFDIKVSAEYDQFGDHSDFYGMPVSGPDHGAIPRQRLEGSPVSDREFSHWYPMWENYSVLTRPVGGNKWRQEPCARTVTDAGSKLPIVKGSVYGVEVWPDAYLINTFGRSGSVDWVRETVKADYERGMDLYGNHWNGGAILTVEVEAYKEGVRLGSATSGGIEVGGDDEAHRVLYEAILEYDMVEEAVKDAQDSIEGLTS